MSGFPQGLRPANWMGDLVSKKIDGELAKTIPVTWFVYPGSHDAATYGSGLGDFSYQCQEKNLYEQMKVGNRIFDLRLTPKDNGNKFIPCHGAAKGTADDFSQGPKQANEKDLAKQIMNFAKEHPSEIIVIKLKFDGLNTDDLRLDFANTAWNLLGDRLLQAPDKGEPNPTYSSAVESNRNIILATGLPNTKFGKPHPISKYFWDVGQNTSNWLGDGNELLWNEPTWQSGELPKVLKSTEEYISKNQDKLSQRDKFWVAYLQLTPVLGQGVVTFFKEGGSIRPKDLALGGGFGTQGKFHGSNAELRQFKGLKGRLWKKHACGVMYDFADTETTGAIVAMNIPGDDDDDDDGPSGKAGGKHGGGKGGRGGGEGGGRGGGEGHGRGGGGGHRGGRGGHD